MFSLSTTSSTWTCEDCAKASNGLAIFSVNPEAIQAMVDVIVAEVCPTAGDPAICLEEMPRFWEQISRIVFPAHWQHICDDLEECETPLKLKVQIY